MPSRCTSGSEIDELTERRGSSDVVGCWNTICACLRISRRTLPVALVTSTPRSLICPALIGAMPRTARATLVFPLPLSPTSPSV
jgi:hypothetical protein